MGLKTMLQQGAAIHVPKFMRLTLQRMGGTIGKQKKVITHNVVSLTYTLD